MVLEVNRKTKKLFISYSSQPPYHSGSFVTCGVCDENYHLACLVPPLPQKPPKGFAWECSLCCDKKARKQPVSSTAAESSRSVVSSHESTSESVPSSRRSLRRQARYSSEDAQKADSSLTTAAHVAPVSPAVSQDLKPGDQGITDHHILCTYVITHIFFFPKPTLATCV